MRKSAFAAAAALVFALAGCSDDDDNPSPTGGTGGGGTGGTATCTQAVVGGEAVTLKNREFYSIPFTTSGAGRVDVTVDWTNERSNVGAFVVAGGSCSQAQFHARGCDFLAESGGDKPHRMSLADLPAGSYELLIVNFNGYPEEAIAAQVLLYTGTGCPAAPGPSPSPTPAS